MLDFGEKERVNKKRTRNLCFGFPMDGLIVGFRPKKIAVPAAVKDSITYGKAKLGIHKSNLTAKE